MSRRSHNVRDQGAQRELAAIDAACAGGPVAADHREIAELVRDLQCLRPQGDATFLHRLDARAAAGFPSATPNGSARHSRVAALSDRVTRRLLPAVAVAASLLVALVVVGTGLRGGGATRFGGGTAADTGPQSLAPAPGSPGVGGEPQIERTSVPPIAPDGGALPGRRDRRVERQASLTLAAGPERLDEVADGVIRVTDRVNGIVASSSVQSTDDDQGGASFDLRVPVGRLPETLAELSKLAHVRARTQSSQDVTAVHASAQERLREALAERGSLLRQLAAADAANESESVRARLRIVNGQIAVARAERARDGLERRLGTGNDAGAKADDEPRGVGA